MLTKNVIRLHGRRESMQLQSIILSYKMNLLLVLQEFSTTLGYRLSIVGKHQSILNISFYQVKVLVCWFQIKVVLLS